MKIIDTAILDALSAEAAAVPRRRRNLNIHGDLSEPIQRLFNAVEPGTYVRPHRHDIGYWELFTVLRGMVRMVTFDDDGRVTGAYLLGPGQQTALVELPGGVWHSVVSLSNGSVFFEVKPGPYVPSKDKNFAPWAPTEGVPRAAALEAWMQSAQVGDIWGG